MFRSAMLFLPVILLHVSVSYGQQAASSGDTMRLPCVQRAGLLLDEALGFMQNNYYRRDFVDWNAG